jgi:hypothetical protein
MKKYQASIGKLQYLSSWPKPEICNIVNKLARFSSCAQAGHFTAMQRVMHYF